MSRAELLWAEVLPARVRISRELSPVHIDGIDIEHAESEDRPHDLRIMRPTRYQLRYFRPAGLSKSVAIHVMLLEEVARNLSCI